MGFTKSVMDISVRHSATVTRKGSTIRPAKRAAGVVSEETNLTPLKQVAKTVSLGMRSL